MFKKIVVGIDGSAHSHRALEYAHGLAERFGAALWLVHAYPHTSDMLGYDEYEKIVSRREIAGQEILDEARQALGQSSIELYEELLEGPPTEAILKVAKIRQVDLIVVGSRGLGSIQEMLLGSVSHQVLHHATCPVLVVR